MTRIDIKQRVADALVFHYRNHMSDWGTAIRSVRKFSASGANNFLLGVMFDRSINADQAWQSGKRINDALGDPEDVAALWRALAKIEKKRLLGFLRYGHGGRAFHRHYRTFGEQLPRAAEIMLSKYGGDPRRIWNNQRALTVVRDRFEEIPGIGPKLSRMALLILTRDYGLLGGRTALKQLDIAPDIHVMRVFKRTGLIESDVDRMAAIIVAQQLRPKYPGELDPPAFEIGREWCRPSKPICEECPISGVCARYF
jgi:endonuclease III